MPDPMPNQLTRAEAENQVEGALAEKRPARPAPIDVVLQMSEQGLLSQLDRSTVRFLIKHICYDKE